MFLSLLEHVQLFAEFEDCFFGRIAALLRGLAAEPGPHLGVCLYLFCDDEVCAVVGGLLLVVMRLDTVVECESALILMLI